MVVKEDGRYRMWYSGSDRILNEFHRIGYAESINGLEWKCLEDPILVPDDPSGYYSVPAVLRDSTGAVFTQSGL